MFNLKKYRMRKTPEFIENRIKWRASQNSLPNKYALLFENLPDEIKIKYTSQFKEEDSGKIILLFTDPNKRWTALGTKMIIGYDGSKLNAVKLNTIQDVTSKNKKKKYELLRAGHKNLEKLNKKLEHELSVIDIDGNETVFITNKGSDMFSLWNIVLMIIRLNSSPK